MADIRSRRSRRYRQQRNQIILLLAILGVVIVVILGIIIGMLSQNGKPNDGNGTEVGATPSTQEKEKDEKLKALIAEADRLAMSYDYDGAIEKIKTWVDYELEVELMDRIDDYELTKASCKRVNISEVTHIFYHSLVVDPEKGFDPKKYSGEGMNQWMTTVDEFNAITQEMYDRGYVMVSLHDLYTITTDENGNQVMKEGNIYLPEGKKAFVLSLDDLSYYHSYDGHGIATKLVIDENGKVVNEYIDKNGDIVYGAYDCVPLMDAFIEKHPDASYRGAKGTIALTGYNGILGYRTDETYSMEYVNNPSYDLDRDKEQWLLAHPDFNLEEERAEAKKVAEAMKANGWTFASHTWGHQAVGNKSLNSLKADNERWQKNVKPLIGDTNVIIFAHGQDLGSWGNYDLSNEKVQYFMDQGFNVFCNVDGSREHMVWFGKNYLRQGRRNLDGLRFYYNLKGSQNNLSDLFDVEEIVDPLRPSLDIY